MKKKTDIFSLIIMCCVLLLYFCLLYRIVEWFVSPLSDFFFAYVNLIQFIVAVGLLIGSVKWLLDEKPKSPKK